MMIKGMIDRLTSSYRKDKDSNIVNVLKMIGDELQDVKDTLFTIRRYRSIDDAEGTTLDRIGSNVGELRGQKEEELYRQYIKTRIKSNISGGEMETLIEVLNILFEGSLKSVQETWNIEDNAIYDHEPASLLITFYSTPKKIPWEVLDRVTAGGVGAFYFNEEVRARWLNLETTVQNIDAFHRHVHTFECGELEPGLSEGGFGKPGHIRGTDLNLESNIDDAELYNKYLNLESTILDRDIIFRFANSFRSGDNDSLLEGGTGPGGHIRKVTMQIESKVENEELYRKLLNLETRIIDRDILFKNTNTFNSCNSCDSILEGGEGYLGQIRNADINVETKITNEEEYKKFLDFAISVKEREIFFKYPSTFSTGQEVLL